MKQITILIAVCVFFSFPFGTAVFGQSCPYCGQQYGGGPSTAGSYLQFIRASHEAICSERGDPVERTERATQSLKKATTRLSELGRLVSTLSIESRRVLNDLPASERRSVSTAMRAVMTRYAKLVEEHQRLEINIRQLRTRVVRQRAEILKNHNSHEYLLREIRTARQARQDVQERLNQVNEELETARNVVAYLEQQKNNQEERLVAAQREYWQAMGKYFDGQDLGSPRDFTNPVVVIPSTTLRRTVIIQNKSLEELVLELMNVESVSPAPAILGVVSVPSNAFATRRSNRPTFVGGKQDLNSLLTRFVSQAKETARLHREANEVRIDSERSRATLERSIAALKNAKVNQTWLTDLVGKRENELSWAVYELDIRTREARQLFASARSVVAKETKWKVLKQIMIYTLNDRSLANIGYANLRTSYDLMDDIKQLPEVLRDVDDPRLAEMVDRFERTPERTAKSYMDRLFNRVKAEKWRAWIKKVVDN